MPPSGQMLPKLWWIGKFSRHVRHLWVQSSLGWGWQGHDVKHGLQREASHVDFRPFDRVASAEGDSKQDGIGKREQQHERVAASWHSARHEQLAHWPAAHLDGGVCQHLVPHAHVGNAA